MRDRLLFGMAVLGLYQGKCVYGDCDCSDEQVWILDNKSLLDNEEHMPNIKSKWDWETLMLCVAAILIFTIGGILIYTGIMNNRINHKEGEITERIRIEQCSTLSDETARALCVTDRPNERG